MPKGRGGHIEEVDKAVGLAVRFHRMKAGMSQEKLGALLGVTFQQVQKYEKGVNRIGPGRLYTLAQVFGVPIGALYPDTQVKPNGSLAGLIALAEDRKGMLLVENIARLATHQRAIVGEFVDLMTRGTQGSKA